MIETLKNTYNKTNTLHHAYLLLGEKDTTNDALLQFFEDSHLVTTKGNPDFYFREYTTFGINDARALKEWASRKALTDDMQVALLSVTTMTHEAQNALLKLFEEPTAGTHFFISASSLELFLPTLRSRCMVISSQQHEVTTPSSITHFLTSHKGERMVLVKKIADTKDKAAAIQLVTDLEKTLHKKYLMNNQTHNDNPEVCIALREIIQCKKFLQGRSPSIKMLLEHIALITPVIE